MGLRLFFACIKLPRGVSLLMENIKTPSFEQLLEAAQIIQKCSLKINVPVDLETDCEIVISQSQFTIRKSEN